MESTPNTPNAPCSCKQPNGSPCGLATVSLAMAYVPCQCFQKLYDADIALSRGTIFQELDKPFIGEEAVCYG